MLKSFLRFTIVLITTASFSSLGKADIQGDNKKSLAVGIAFPASIITVIGGSIVAVAQMNKKDSKSQKSKKDAQDGSESENEELIKGEKETNLTNLKEFPRPPSSSLTKETNLTVPKELPRPPSGGLIKENNSSSEEVAPSSLVMLDRVMQHDRDSQANEEKEEETYRRVE
jgi:hypothetical protein